MLALKFAPPAISPKASKVDFLGQKRQSSFCHVDFFRITMLMTGTMSAGFLLEGRAAFLGIRTILVDVEERKYKLIIIMLTILCQIMWRQIQP
ncbi:hypothetical protein EB052_00415 [bacterium]|nr:hypothetical protein [bacterium]